MCNSVAWVLHVVGLLKAQKPVGRAERGVTQQNKAQLRKIEEKWPQRTLLENFGGNKEFMIKLLVKQYKEREI